MTSSIEASRRLVGLVVQVRLIAPSTFFGVIELVVFKWIRDVYENPPAPLWIELTTMSTPSSPIPESLP